MATPMCDAPQSRDDPRAASSLDLGGAEVEVFVWRGGATWRAAAEVGRREVMVLNGASRDDALARLRESMLANAEVARSLGLAPVRRWSANPYWKGR
ncbi:MAG: hypothetical protein OXG43_00505 [Chloroflexi bacterium]|nr:hypothetical protein [Chloroflexota bacterium]